MLLSDLAEHAINLAGDVRCSLLIDALPPGSESLAGMRLTIQGEAHGVGGEEAEKSNLLLSLATQKPLPMPSLPISKPIRLSLPACI